VPDRFVTETGANGCVPFVVTGTNPEEPMLDKVTRVEIGAVVFRVWPGKLPTPVFTVRKSTLPI
jgi:hypothetical protein